MHIFQLKIYLQYHIEKEMKFVIFFDFLFVSNMIFVLFVGKVKIQRSRKETKRKHKQKYILSSHGTHPITIYHAHVTFALFHISLEEWKIASNGQPVLPANVRIVTLLFFPFIFYF